MEFTNELAFEDALIKLLFEKGQPNQPDRCPEMADRWTA